MVTQKDASLKDFISSVSFPPYLSKEVKGGEKMVTKRDLGMFLVMLGTLAFITFLVLPAAQAVTGASVSASAPQTAPNDTAGSDPNAYAGNVTELSITGYSTTQTWQGYFGNVSGTIQLADSNDNVFYNWSVASPGGEVYATRNQSIAWSNVQCFNFTANGSAGAANLGGTTNLDGLNLTTLEAQYNIDVGDVDGVNETFSLSGNHDLFFTASQQFSAGECLDTLVYDSTGEGVNNNFEEVLLYEPTTWSVIFTAILDSDVSGFDGATHDFEMLVLEDGHGTDVSSTTYYFFLEIE